MRKLIRALQLILLLVLAVSLVMTVRMALEDRESASEYAEAAQIAGLTTPAKQLNLPAPSSPGGAEEVPLTPAERLADIDLEALVEVNSDVVGWIEVPDTDLSYPLLQTNNNDYYLNHTWMKKYNRGGAIYLDWRDSKDLSDFHTIIYGHRMGNTTMFGTLKYYQTQDYWQANPYVYLVLDSGIYRYDIFAAYEASVTSPVYDRKNSISEEEFIQFCLNSSAINTGIVPEPGCNILTLSTCTGRGHANRWVIQAVLHVEQEA